MDDLLRDFLTESNENLLRLDREIVALEKSPDDLELLKSIFRTIHTIKGTCGFLDLSRLEQVAHSAENVLGLLRDGDLAVTPAVVSDVLAAVDAIRQILDGLEATEQEPDGDDAALRARLDRWVPGGDAAEEVDPDSIFLSPAAVAALAAPAQTARVSVAESSLRVNVEILDLLMNLAGELVLTRNQLAQLSGEEEGSRYHLPLQHLNRVTSDLQEAVMKTRMQPIGNAWSKLPRLVRDLCQASGKEIDVQMSGAETELDRQILEAIRDPLTHMVRNSADHGIERPAARRDAGKPEKGAIHLEAFHEGGQIVIEIRDDGKGLDAGAIREKAISQGLVARDAAEAMTESQLFRFIFEPGFSTAEKITSVSGRGVGMDVVRSNIEQIGGTVELSSTRGRGTTFRIKIPLTLAILSALIVGAGEQSFAMPQVGVLELVRVTGENRGLLERVNGKEFFRLRETLLPLVRLGSILELPHPGSNDVSIVVCQVGAHRFGLVVDTIFDTHEIVVKPIGRMVQRIPFYSGTTILGDGRVIMILDVPSIAAASQVAGDESERNAADGALHDELDEERIPLVVFSSAEGVRQAVPLSLVSRLEKVSGGAIEQADGRWLVQYRGSLLPLVPGSPSVRMQAPGERPVLVFSDGGRHLGLAVEEIHDIVEDHLELQIGSATPGILGTAVVAGRSTEVLDLDAFLSNLEREEQPL